MTERTTISVSKDTKRLLDEDRDSQPWDTYLANLIQSNSQDTEILTEAHIDDIASRTAKRVWENMPQEARSR